MNLPKGTVRLSGGVLPSPADFNFEILSVDDNVPMPPNNGDMIDLSSVTIASSPSDIAQWPITRSIKQIVMSPSNGLSFVFDKELPESWKWFTGHGDDNFQYTVWAAAFYNGKITAAAFIQMWEGRDGTGTMDPNPPLNWSTHFHQNWAYSSRWGDLNLYVPKAGDQMGFLVSAGNGRDQSSVTSVRERSNIVVINVPSNSQGSWSF